MIFLNGEEHFDVKELAKMLGFAHPKSIGTLRHRFKNSDDPFPEPDFIGKTYEPFLWKKSRLGEINEWHNRYIKAHPARPLRRGDG